MGSGTQTRSSPIPAQAMRPLSSGSAVPQALWAPVPFLNREFRVGAKSVLHLGSYAAAGLMFAAGVFCH